MSKIDHFIAVSDYLCAELMDRGIARDRITVVPNGIRLSDEERNAARRELGFSLADRVIGTVGRLEPAKGHRYLLEALRILVQKWPQIKCVIVGAGRLEKELRTLVADYGFGNHVLFTGFRNYASHMLQASDLFVLPSRSEGLSNALLEAMSCGLPAVATK